MVQVLVSMSLFSDQNTRIDMNLAGCDEGRAKNNCKYF